MLHVALLLHSTSVGPEPKYFANAFSKESETPLTIAFIIKDPKSKVTSQ